MPRIDTSSDAVVAEKVRTAVRVTLAAPAIEVSKHRGQKLELNGDAGFERFTEIGGQMVGLDDRKLGVLLIAAVEHGAMLVQRSGQWVDFGGQVEHVARRQSGMTGRLYSEERHPSLDKQFYYPAATVFLP